MATPFLSPSPLTTPSLRLGILHNRHSGGNRKNPHAFRAFQKAHPRMAYGDVRTPPEVAGALDEFARQGINVIAVNGGDGTVQATLSALLRRSPFEQPPLVVPLCAGTTNMIAADVGLGGAPVKALARLLTWIDRGGDKTNIITRPILRLQIAPTAEPLFGMFFGAGLIYSAIQYSRRYLHPWGLSGAGGAGLALLHFLTAMIRRDKAVITSTRIKVSLDGHPPEQHDSALLLISTLERLLLGLRPYWGTEAAPLRYTAIQAHPQRLVRSLPSLLRGKQNKYLMPEHGYISYNASEIRLDVQGGFTLDGEMFTPEDTQGPLLLSEDGPIPFIRF